ncbi:MAG: glycosyltransferase [Chthoniobacterales bacterium]
MTQFYSPLSGGVKRYLHEKIAYIERAESDDEHVLIIPGARTEMTTGKRSRVYSIRSPLVSRATQYHALLNLGALEEIIARERPDIIESSDPYQVGWRAARIGERLRIPVVAFYHSHFTQAYLRGPAALLGKRGAAIAMRAAEAYTRALYNRFEATLVPSAKLAEVLRTWGVMNTESMPLGVNTEVFRPRPDAAATRARLRIPAERKLLLYVGRLAPEKNTRTLFSAFELLASKKFHLLVIGSGQERGRLQKLADTTGAVTWLPYCADASELAQYYRAADLFVHPGIEETFGLVALESQACGTPVVGIRGSYMDGVILHSEEAWSAENSAGALAAAIETLSKSELTPLGGAAAAQVREKYAWPRVFARLFSVYRRVLSDYKGARSK